MRALLELLVGHPARVHAGTTYSDLTTTARYRPDHVLDVVVASGHLLVSLRARRGVSHQEHLDRLPFSLHQGPRETESVVAPLRSIGWVVQNQKELSHIHSSCVS